MNTVLAQEYLCENKIRLISLEFELGSPIPSKYLLCYTEISNAQREINQTVLIIFRSCGLKTGYHK